MTERLYKFLGKNGEPAHGGSGAWPLPTRHDDGTWTPGEWRRVEGPLVLRLNGLHLVRERPSDMLAWMAETLYGVETRGERIDLENKIVVREARLLHQVKTWDERVIRLFAYDCIERALYLHGPILAIDLRECVAMLRRFANNKATAAELVAAAREVTTWAATRAVIHQVEMADKPRAMTTYGPEAIARAKIEAEDRVAALNTERQWQFDRLMWYLHGEVDLEPLAVEATV